MNTPRNEVITSFNMLIRDNNHSTCSVWGRKACFSLRCKFIPELPGKMSHTPVKQYPNPDPSETKFPDPTLSENILKNVPRPWTGFDPVRSNSGFWVAPIGLYLQSPYIKTWAQHKYQISKQFC